MKKILMTLCALMISAASFAQMSSGGFKMSSASTYWGIRLGYTSAFINDDYDLDSRGGMNLGAVVGLKCSPSLPIFLESGVYYTGKGGQKGEFKVRADYLEIPVLMKYGIATGVQDLSVLPYIGPTFNFGVAGKTKREVGGEKFERDTFGDNRLKRFDVGVKLGCGVEYQMVYAELGYHWGVTNIGDGFDAHNRAFYMNIGINF